MMLLILLVLIIVIVCAFVWFRKNGSEEEEFEESEELEEVSGGYELVENKISREGKIETAKPSITSFLQKANLKDKRLICVTGLQFCGREELIAELVKKHGFKRAHAKSDFEGKQGSFVCCADSPAEVEALFDVKAEPADRNFVLINLVPKNVQAVGRIIRTLKEQKKKSNDINERRDITAFRKTYKGMEDRKKALSDAEKLLKEYGKSFRVYPVKYDGK